MYHHLSSQAINLLSITRKITCLCSLFTFLIGVGLQSCARPALDVELPRQEVAQRSYIKDTDIEGILKLARSTYTNPGSLPDLKVKKIARDEEPGGALMTAEDHKLSVKHTAVSAELAGPIAHVQVRQVFTNPSEKPIEVVYTFPLPENAAVDDMRMVIGERIIEAQIKRRAEAKRIYNQAKASGKTAALLEQERPNIFTQSVANIEPGCDIEVITHYVQRLTYQAGEYEFVFPMVIGPRFIPGEKLAGPPGGKGWSLDTDEVPDGSRITPPIFGKGDRSGKDISLEVSINAGASIQALSTPTHPTFVEEHDHWTLIKLSEADRIPNRDFIIRYRVDADEPSLNALTHRDPKAEGARAGGFLTLTVHPPKIDVEREVGRRELIFVLDTSGSMRGEPIHLAKNAARQAIEMMQPTDLFNVIGFAGDTSKLFKEVRPANQTNLSSALRYINGFGAGGGTMMNNAVTEALASDVTEGYHRYVFFLTDGLIGNERAIFENATNLISRLKRKGQRGRVFSFGVSGSPNRDLLEGIAKSGDGLAVYATSIEDSISAVNQFYQLIDMPVISNLRIDWGGLAVSGVTPHQLPDLFATRPLVVNARYQDAAQGTVKIKGERDGKPIELSVEVSLPEQETRHDALASLWARDQVASYEREMWSAQRRSDVKEKIIQLGLAFRILTPFTSFVAVDQSGKVVGTDHQSGTTDSGYSMEASGSGMGFLSVSGAGGTSFGFGGGRSSLGYGGGTSRAGKRAKRRKKISMRLEKPEGALPKMVIKRVIYSRRGGYQNCYERSLQREPKLNPKILRLGVKISTTGRLIGVKGLSNLGGSIKMDECIRRHLKRLKFPRAAEMTKVTIKFKFK